MARWVGSRVADAKDGVLESWREERKRAAGGVVAMEGVRVAQISWAG